MKIVIMGIVKQTSRWVDISTVDIDDPEVSEEEVNQEIDRMRNLIATCFKDGSNGYMTLGDVVISTQSFAAISVSVVK